MPRTRRLVALVFVLLAGCAGPAPTATPAPTTTPSPTASPATGDASVVIRLSGREVELAGGSCTWFEDEGKLIVDVGPNAAGDQVRLTSPLSWSADELPPGAASADPALEVALAGQELQVDQASLDGEMSIDAGNGFFSALTAAGGPITGDFLCPTVIDG